MKKYNFNKIGIFILSVFMMGTLSCTDDLDINTDPLVATEVNPSLLFPTIMVSLSQNRTIEMGPQTEFWSQQWTSGGSAGVFTNPEIYITSPNSTNNLWVGQYSTSLRNLQQIRELTLRNNPQAENIIGQAKVFEAFVFLNLTQFYGDIPFSQATQIAEFPNPVFDSQEDVLRGIVNRLDEGLGLLSTETAIVSNGDLLYNGDRQNWIRFANSLKLKTLMLIANKDAASVQAEIQAVANEPLIMENSQNAYFPYSDNVGNENPIWRLLDAFSGGTNVFLYSGSTLVDIMNENSDPRRATYFAEVADGGYVGQDPGVFSPTGISSVSLNIIRPDLEDRYATASETYYFLAEAALKGYISGDAQEFYKKGLEASMDSYDGQPGEIPAADKQGYIAARGDISGLADAEALNQLYTEQYVALFSRGLEAWTHWRRTKTPDFILPVDAVVGDIIRRIQYPLSELSSNPNAPDVVPLTTPMYFEN